MEQLQKEKQLVTGMIDSGPEESKNKDDQRFIPCGEKVSNSDKPLMQDSDLKTSAFPLLNLELFTETSQNPFFAWNMNYWQPFPIDL